MPHGVDCWHRDFRSYHRKRVFSNMVRADRLDIKGIGVNFSYTKMTKVRVWASIPEAV